MPLVDVFGTPQERRALHLYRETAGPEMSNYFDAPFWTATVLQISHDTPAAKHILMATGSIYEYLMETSSTIVPPQEFALIQTSKSIDKLVNDKTNLVAILTCVILFTAYGNLMDDMSSLRHLKSGLDIVREIQLQPDHPYWSGLSTSERDVVEGLLIPIIYRLSHWINLVDPVGATTDALKKSSFISVSVKSPIIPSTFTNIRHAEACHMDVYRWALGHLRPADTLSGYRISPEDEATIYLESQSFIRAIDRFIVQLETDKSVRSTAIVGAAAILRVNHFAARVCLKAINFTLESEYDKVEVDFKEIVDGCKKFLEKADMRQHSLRRKLFFGTDLSFLICLFMAARGSRNPALRREAIMMLATSDISEGMMGSHTCAVIASAVMRIEESGLDLITRASDIPESHRIRLHEASMFTYAEPHLQVRVSYTRYPYTPDDSGQMRTETFWVGLHRERSAVVDRVSSLPPHKYTGPTMTPYTAEGTVRRDQENQVYPDIVLVRSTIAWADKSTSPPTYDYLHASHPLTDKLALRF